MLKCSWVITFALGLALLSGQAWSQGTTEDQPRQEYSAPDSNANSDSQNGQPIDLSPALEGIEAAIRELIADEDQIEAHRKQEAEQRDLRAQEEMAKWSFWMTLATIGGVVATFVGLALLSRTLHHTRRAADYTQRMLTEAEATTSEARNANVTNRVVGQAQIRPWVLFDGLLDIPEDDAANNNAPILKLALRWKNFGGTPAIKMQMQTADFKIVPFSSSEVPKIELGQFKAPHGVLGPGGEIIGRICILAGDRLQKFVTNQSAIILHGRLRYSGPSDFVETTYYTEATIRITCGGLVDHKGKKFPRVINETIGDQNKTN